MGKPGEKKHSKLGASIAKRWLNCVGSVNLSEKAPPVVEGPHAAKGTKAHDLLEYRIHRDILDTPVAKLPKIPKKVPKEDEDAVQVAIDWIELNYMKDLGDILLAETKADLSHIDGEMFGTADISIVRLFGRLTVVDYKNGAGIVVEVVDENGNLNEQLMYYLLGIAKKYDFNFDEYEIGIIQPHAPHPEGPERMKLVTFDDLMKFEDSLRKGAKRFRDGKNTLFPGEWCRFCPATPICPALGKKSVESARDAFDDDFDSLDSKLPALKHPGDITPEKMGHILRNVEILDSWISAMRGYAQGLLERGGKIDGFKLVQKKPRRQWNDEPRAKTWALDLYGADALDLKSPAQLEKLSKEAKEFVSEEATMISSGVTIAPEKDSRPEVNHIKDVFDDEGETNEKEESHDEEKVVNEKAPGKSKSKAKGKKETVRKIGKSPVLGEGYDQSKVSKSKDPYKEIAEDFDLGF